MPGADEVNRNLRDWVRRRKAALLALGDFYAGKMEGEAKQNASWTDRTGAARQGLFGEAQERDSALLVRLAGGEEHNIYLELSNQGRYAILEPTVKRNAPGFFQDAERVIRG